MAPYGIVLANNHVPFRQCLRRLLKENKDLEVVGEAEDGLELLNLLSLKKVAPHMIILDLSLPNLHKIEGIRKLRTIQPQIKILTLSMHKDKEYLGKAILNGVEGYLLKENVAKELLPAIEMVRQGRIYIPPFP